MTTEKALREALTRIKTLAVAGRHSAHGQCKNLVGDFWAIADQAEAALSLPETVGEPVAWMYVWPKNNLPYLTRHIYDERLSVEARAARAAVGVKEFPLYAAPPSQPAQGWKLVPVEPTPKMSAAGFCVSEAEHDPAGVYRAMLAAAPAAPPVPKTPAQEDERKWRAFTWPDGEGEPPLVCLRHGMADITPPCRKWCGGAACTPPTQAKPTNGEGA